VLDCIVDQCGQLGHSAPSIRGAETQLLAAPALFGGLIICTIGSVSSRSRGRNHSVELEGSLLRKPWQIESATDSSGKSIHEAGDPAWRLRRCLLRWRVDTTKSASRSR